MTGEALYEAIEQIDERYIEEAAAFRSRKTTVFHRMGWIAACLCLAAVGSVMLLSRFTQTPPDIGEEPYIIVNKLQTPPAMGDIDVKGEHYIINSQPVYESKEVWTAMKRDFKENIGETYDAFIARIPETMQTNLTYYTFWARSSLPDGAYTLHDYIFDCSSEDSHIRLAISHVGTPMRCWLIGTNAKPSVVNGTEMTVSGSHDDYYVTFEKNGIYYDLEAHALTLSQLEELLLSLTAE